MGVNGGFAFVRKCGVPWRYRKMQFRDAFVVVDGTQLVHSALSAGTRQLSADELLLLLTAVGLAPPAQQRPTPFSVADLDALFFPISKVCSCLLLCARVCALVRSCRSHAAADAAFAAAPLCFFRETAAGGSTPEYNRLPEAPSDDCCV